MGGFVKWQFLLTLSTGRVYADIVGESEKLEKYVDVTYECSLIQATKILLNMLFTK